MRLLLLSFIFLFPSTLFAQRAEGRFLATSAKLGEPVQYTLWLRHDADQEVLFPDSTFDFAPFELLEKKYFPTKTTAAGSLDSAVYTLATYELGAVQTLSIPVWILDKKPKDGRKALYPAPDSIRLEELIQTMPDSLQLQEQTDLQRMQKQFNYPYLLMSSGIFLLIGLFTALLFGKTIQKNWRVRALRKKHLRFIIDFDRQMEAINATNLEHAIAFWKQYTAGLTKMPLASYTTKEIRQVLPVQEVVEALEQADKIIYAGQAGEGMKDSLRILKSYTQGCFERAVEEIKRGKTDKSHIKVEG